MLDQEKLSQPSIPKINLPLKERSILFAPMEGITDELYRETILELYPEWDMIATDFLRVPSVGKYPQKHILKHFGNEQYQSKLAREKTIYQILSPEIANTVDTLNKIKNLNFHWLDLNLGCPSKTVCKNRGGSFLLSDLIALRKVIRLIRSNWDNTFTAKIRVGYENDFLFKDILTLLEDEGVDAITIHARTRTEMYKGIAKWDYVRDAVSHIKHTPIIGNGDIWTVKDINKYFDFTNCHSVMIARGALKTPWLARLHQNKETETHALRAFEIKRYFTHFNEKLKLKTQMEDVVRLRRIKAIARYIFDDFEDGDLIKRSILRSKGEDEMFTLLDQLAKKFI